MVPDFLTIAEAAALIGKRELSPVELTESRLARIERLDDKLHSFIRVLREPALAAARRAEAEIISGNYRGPLHGIPIGLKDIYETKGVPTTGHSKILIDHVPQQDAASVRRLTEACAMMLQAMGGHAPGVPASADRPVPDYRAALSGDIKGLRIGLIRHFYENDNPADEATRQGIAAAVKVFEDLGCSVRELRLSPLAEWAACGVMIMLSDAYAIHQATLRERFGDYGELFRDRMALAALVSVGDYVQAVRRRRQLTAEFAAAMADFDLAITAAASGQAPSIHAVRQVPTFEPPIPTMPVH